MKYVLGLDLGVASVGWAVVPCEASEFSTKTLRMGSRIFSAGAPITDKGKCQSPNADRRAARGIRRNLWRRRRRLVKLFNILQNAGLLPQIACHSPEKRQDLFNDLDKDLMSKYLPNASRITSQTYIYQLRAKALDVELSLEAIGRIFYSLGQRRGFMSNKKITSNEEEQELAGLKKDIDELNRKIVENGCRTLGEYYATLDPENPEDKRIRGRWVGRKAYIDEFEAIWKSQKRFYPDLFTDVLKKDVYNAIFFQRPLKSQEHLIAKCELEPTQRCVAKADPAFQEFRYWQRLLDLQIFDPELGKYRILTLAEQDCLAQKFETFEKVSFTEMRKRLNIERSKNSGDLAWKFNFELENGDKEILGNRTRTKIRAVLAENGVQDASNEFVDKIAAKIIFYNSVTALEEKLFSTFDLSRETAKALAKVRLEPDYGSISRMAIEKILPLMKKEREPFATIRKAVYGEARCCGVVDRLQPVEKALGQLRNPTVIRTLTEMRKVVNEIIRRYGKPEYIRLELARDLKNGTKVREEIFKQNKTRERERKDIEKKILDLMGPSYNLTKSDVLKYRLWKECGEHCPYTGDPITAQNLFSSQSSIDIEHIIPYSISLDDSFANKTLCFAAENRNVKKQQTPFQCYSGDPSRWQDILTRVAKFSGVYKKRKLELFRMETVDTQYAQTRLLNDTRYASKVALKYLSSLYGSVDGCDSNGDRRVFAVVGSSTETLRRLWDLNAPLYSQEEKDLFNQEDATLKKKRDDHRHHAIDALVVAYTTPSLIQQMNNAANGYRWLRPNTVAKPCDNFNSIVQEVVDGIVVSRRIDRRVSGAIHHESNFKNNRNGKSSVRKPVSSLKATDIKNIIDPRIAAIVKAKLDEIGYEKADVIEKDPPCIITDSYPRRRIPIKSVRCWVREKNCSIRKGRHENFVYLGANHHLEIYAELNEKGEEKDKWKSEIVTLREAYRRVKDKEPVVKRNHGTNTKFKFSLANGEAFQDDTGKIYVVKTVFEESDGKKTRRRIACMLNTAVNGEIIKHEDTTLKKKNFVKLAIDVLGGYYPSND